MTLPPSTQLGAYNQGYVFFAHAHDPVAEGIDWFERFGRAKNLAVHHTGIVGDANVAIEAHWRVGVWRARLTDYLNSTETLIVFRKPKGWTPGLGKRIAAAAESRIGRPYNKGLIFAQLCSNTLIGYTLNRLFNCRPEIWVSKMLDRRQAFICSELSAWSLDQQPEFCGHGILSAPLDTITPQELFDDTTLWEDNQQNETC